MILSITNEKGGTGKTTTAHALGADLLRQGFRVLFIDLDAQGSLSYAMGADPGPANVADLLTKRKSPRECISKTPQGDLLSSSPELSEADVMLNKTGKEYRLIEGLRPIMDQYDYIIMDTPPALGILTVNALTASESVLIPAQADVYSLQGIGRVYRTIEAVREYCNPQLGIMGLLLTRYNKRAILSREIAEMMNEAAAELQSSVFTTAIRECISLKEAQAYRRDIFDYAPKSNAAADYHSLTAEIMERSKGT